MIRILGVAILAAALSACSQGLQTPLPTVVQSAGGNVCELRTVVDSQVVAHEPDLLALNPKSMEYINSVRRVMDPLCQRPLQVAGDLIPFGFDILGQVMTILEAKKAGKPVPAPAPVVPPTNAPTV